jgi:Apea-like HEPN
VSEPGELLGVLESLANAIWQLLASVSEADWKRDLLYARRRVVQRPLKDSPIVTEVAEPLWNFFALSRRDSIIALPEFEALTSALAASGYLTDLREMAASVSTDLTSEQDFYRGSVFSLIVAPLLEVVASSALAGGNGNLHKGDISPICKEVAAEISGQKSTAQLLAPILGLSLDRETIQLQPGLSVRGMTDADHNLWLNTLGVVDEQLVLRCESIIDSVQLVPVQSGLWDPVNEVATTIRLLKCADISLAARLFVKPWRRRPIGALPVDQRPNMGSVTRLTEGDGEELPKFWSWLQATKQTSQDRDTGIALRRFDRAVGEGNFDDRIIDVCVALDALYAQGTSDELTYKVCVRAAFLLGDQSGGRKYIFNLLHEAYTQRGSVVHGSRSVNQGNLKSFNVTTSPDDLLNRSVGVLRDSIIAWKSLATTIGDFRDANPSRRGQLLDENVLSDGSVFREQLGPWVHSYLDPALLFDSRD